MAIQQPTPKKSLGQHWLDDAPSLTAMVQAAEIGPDDVVLEIGPGMGTLTRRLVDVAAKVVAVEFDEALARDLPARVLQSDMPGRELSDSKTSPEYPSTNPADNPKKPELKLEVIQQDILRFDLTTLPVNYKVVANIPYYLTSNLIRVLSESSNPPQRTVLLVQKEVAERIAAKPGDMSVLSVTAQFYWSVSLGRVVKAALFTPPPKVDSQIVSLVCRKHPLFPDVVPKLFFQVVKAGFGERRKTLRNSLSGGLQLNKEQTEALLRGTGIDPGLRAQALTMEQWHALYGAYRHTGSSTTAS